MRLSEFTFTIQYRPARVKQVPDALAKLLKPKSSTEAGKLIEDVILTFQLVNVVKLFSIGREIFLTT